MIERWWNVENKRYKLRLTKLISRVAMSLIPYDIVFYKDDDERLYRLMGVPHVEHSEMNPLEMSANKNKYAPEVVEGDVVSEDDKEISIRLDRNGNNNGVYRFTKNAEEFMFWDITDYVKGDVDIDVLNPNMKKGSGFNVQKKDNNNRK